MRYFEGNLDNTVTKISEKYPDFENFEIKLKQSFIGSDILFEIHGYKKVKN